MSKEKSKVNDIQEKSSLTESDIKQIIRDDLIPFAVISQGGSILKDTFSFVHSFGYDSLHPFNVCGCDADVVAWAAGSYLALHDLAERSTVYRRSSTGGSIGHIIKNPSTTVSHIAVGEGGTEWATPIIVIYEWPSLEVVSVLRKGTLNSYANLDYSPDGTLLASVGGSPDYNLTVWDWEHEQIVLQASAFSSSVYNVQFSTHIYGHLTTSGAGHIKFWKMAETFTKLKLKGELGHFGKTEICDIYGVLPMPDEKVLSGCSWGNILVWQNGLVKMDVCRKGRQPCHTAPVTQILHTTDPSEVTTVGLDGCICTWYWDTVSQADPPDTDPVVELNPVAEVSLPGAKLMAIAHRADTKWFAQDATGSIWTVNLDFESAYASAETIEPKRVMKAHGGPVVGLAALRRSSLLLTCGADELLLHSAPSGPLLLAVPHQGTACSMLYLPSQLDCTGRSLVVGFVDGSIRLIVINTTQVETTQQFTEDPECAILLQLLRPHSCEVTAISVNEQCSILLTSSMDSTVFLYRPAKLQELSQLPRLQPLCFIQTPRAVTCITWKPSHNTTVLLAGHGGLVMEAQLPDILQQPELEEITSYRREFVSSSVTLLQDLLLRYKPPQLDTERKNTVDDDDEDVSSEDREILIEEDDPYEIELVIESQLRKKRVLWACYSADSSEEVWAAQERVGALLRLRPGAPLFACAVLPGAWQTAPASQIYINESRHFVLGMSDGEIRVTRLPEPKEDHSVEQFARREERRLRLKKLKRLRPVTGPPSVPVPVLELMDYLRLPMHDRGTGTVTLMAFSHDREYFYTAGGDGNVFSYKYSPIVTTEDIPEAYPCEDFIEKLKEVKASPEDVAELSHEQLARQRQQQSWLRHAAEHRALMQEQLADLALEFKELARLNSTMPPAQQLVMEMEPLAREALKADLAQQMERLELALAQQLQDSTGQLQHLQQRFILPLDIFPFQLSSILEKDYSVTIIRQKKLDDQFYLDLEEVKELLHQEILKSQMSQDGDVSFDDKLGMKELSDSDEQDAPLMHGLPPQPPPPRALASALRQYLQRLQTHYQQRTEVKEHQAKKIALEKQQAAEAGEHEHQEESVGEYCLKSQLDKAPPPVSLHQTTLQMFLARQEMFEIQHKFNESLVSLRDDKAKLLHRLSQLVARLEVIGDELPSEYIRPPPFILPVVDTEKEYPERNLVVELEHSGKILPRSPRRRFSVAPPSHPRSFPMTKLLQSDTSIKDSDPLAAYWDMVKKQPNNVDTQSPLFMELKQMRIIHLIEEQDEIIREMLKKSSVWEDALQELGEEREEVLQRAQLLKLHLLTLTQQQLILQAQETPQAEQMERVRVNQEQVKIVQDRMRVLQRELDGRREHTSALETRLKELQQQQQAMNPDSRFSKFLRKIYNKKYKPPKLDSDSSSESSDLSSSEESSDSGSMEGMARVGLDSNACPPGCDPQIYEQTIELRFNRYDIENQIKEDEKLIKTTKREIDIHNKELLGVVAKLEEAQNKLKEILCEKQKQLNEVECVVVLSADQCSAEAMEALEQGQAVTVIPGPTLQRLQQRVLDLRLEADQHKLRHQSNKEHLKHMRADCQLMRSQVAELRGECAETVRRKLGPRGSRGAGALLDAVLADMAGAFKLAAASGLTTDMQAQLTQWTRKTSELQRQYCSALQENSKKLHLAAALQAQLMEPADKEASLGSEFWPGGCTEEEHRRDLVRLRRLRSQQRLEIEELRAEVQHLKLKPAMMAETPASLYSAPASATPTLSPTPKSHTAKWTGAALAQLLHEAGATAAPLAADGALLDCIAELLPDLLVGKLNTDDAAETIVRKLSSTRISCNADTGPARQAIADLLALITDHNIKLGDLSSQRYSIKIDEAYKADTVEGTLLELLDRGAGTQAAVDAAVASLLWRSPLILTQLPLKTTPPEFPDTEHDSETVTRMWRMMVSCLEAQRCLPSEHRQVAEECLLNLQESRPPHSASMSEPILRPTNASSKDL